jgi:hypothetical protein
MFDQMWSDLTCDQRGTLRARERRCGSGTATRDQVTGLQDADRNTKDAAGGPPWTPLRCPTPDLLGRGQPTFRWESPHQRPWWGGDGSV